MSLLQVLSVLFFPPVPTALEGMSSFTGVTHPQAACGPYKTQLSGGCNQDGCTRSISGSLLLYPHTSASCLMPT